MRRFIFGGLLIALRFGNRVAFRVEIEPVAGDALVPSSPLRPLVENAVYHGLALRREGGTVSIRAGRSGKKLAP
jgi:two-component system sensor histidine kinase YesM